MRAFTREAPALTISEVSRRTGLPRPTVRRLLHTLVQLGYVDTSGQRFSLGIRTLNLSYAFLSSVPLREIAIPHMLSLVELVKESCVLSLLDDVDVIEVAQVPVERIVAVALTVSSRFPAHATSAGRILIGNLPPADRADVLDRLAAAKSTTSRAVVNRARLEEALDQARRQGWAMVDQELEEGIRSIAVPVRDADGEVVAALSVWSYSSRVSLRRFRSEILPHLRETASWISRGLSGASRRA
jgi:IclR family pca regulon transcriptional regulator